MYDHFKVRTEYGSTYVTTFPDGLVVPWKLLTLEEYLAYENDIRRGAISSEHLENEVFNKCVLDEDLVRQSGFLKSGIVHTVVSNIWAYSGPSGVDGLNEDFEAARQKLLDRSTQVFHQLVQLILNVYPYKPEEVYRMDYPTLMLRAAQAESRLMELGLVKEPIYFYKEDQTEQSTGPRFANLNKEPVQPKKPEIDIPALWKQAQKQSVPKREPIKDTSKKWWNVSPVLESQQKQTINFAQDKEVADNTALDNHDINEPKEMREYLFKKKAGSQIDQMIEDAYVIYKDLIDNLPKK